MRSRKLLFSLTALFSMFFCLPILAAPSVRRLGGSGSYKSVSSVTRNSSAVARGGSVRVAVTDGNKEVKPTAGSVSNSSRGTSSRLSIGKYLSDGTSVSGGSSLRPQVPGAGSGSTIDSDVITDLQDNVDQIRRDVDDLSSAFEVVSNNYVTKDDFALKADADAVYTKDDMDAKLDEALAVKADIDSVYTKENLDAKLDESLAGKADLENVYTKTDVDQKLSTALAGKVDADSVYTKTEVEERLSNSISGKVDSGTVYTKAEVDEKLAQAATDGEITLAGYATKVELETKADKNNLDSLAERVSSNENSLGTLETTYAKKADLEVKADKANLDSLTARVSANETAISKIDTKVDTSAEANQVLAGTYTISGILNVPTPALP